MISIKSRFLFQVSSWFEVFFALQALTDPLSRIHASWKDRALRLLSSSFHKKFALLGGSAYIWPVLADTVLDLPMTLPFEERLSKFAALPAEQIQQTLFIQTLHEAGPVNQLLSGRADLIQTINKVSRTKREWLAFLGLYPPRKDSPLLQGLNLLLRSPKNFQRIAGEVLEIFWNKEFRSTWQMLLPKLEASKEEKERLFESCSLDEFFRLSLLRVEYDRRKNAIKAARGGYVLPFRQMAQAVILPSAFNDKRHWTTYDNDPKGVIAFLPYFDPSLSLKLIYNAEERETAEPELDAALIFKALGDTTRFAMVSLIANSPCSSAALAKTMSLSRPTVSHHIHVLRDAGLLEEKAQGNVVLLSLRRNVLEKLSQLAIESLYESDENVELKKTRKK